MHFIENKLYCLHLGGHFDHYETWERHSLRLLFSQFPKKPVLPLTQIGINCVLIHFNGFWWNYALRNSCFELHFTTFLFKITFLAAILEAILNFEHTHAIMLMIMLDVTKKINSSVFQVVNVLSFQCIFTEKCCFGAHFEYDAW